MSFRGTRSLKWLLLCSWIALAFTQASIAKSQHVFAFKVVTSSEDEFWTNSVIIEGPHEVMLVDAQLTKANAEKVLQQIQATKKPLSIIYITHEHADHFLGLEIFREAYPPAGIGDRVLGLGAFDGNCRPPPVRAVSSCAYA